jgi:hypothetical protein
MDGTFDAFLDARDRVRMVFLESDQDAPSGLPLDPSLERDCHVLSLPSSEQRVLLESFPLIPAVARFPSLLLFAPNSDDPAVVYTGALPDRRDLLTIMEALKQAPPAVTRSPVTVKLTTPTGGQIRREFPGEAQVGAIYHWVSATLHLPYVSFVLSIRPGDEPLPPPTSERPICIWGPIVRIRAALRDAPATAPLRRPTAHRPWSFLIFGGDDPMSFWRDRK